MKKLITEIVGGESYKYYPLGKYSVKAPEVCGGRPTFKYTRVEMTFILNLLADGESIDDLAAAYEGRITHEAILEAIRLVTSKYSSTLPELETA